MPEKYRRPHNHEPVQAVERMKRDWAAHVAGTSLTFFFHYHGTSPHCIGTRLRLPSLSTTVSIVSVGQML